MSGALPGLPSCSASWWYSKNQTEMFTPLTRVNRPHHQARGFDHARERGGARHSKLMRHAPPVTELTFDCSNSVTNRGQSRQKLRAAGACRMMAGGSQAANDGRAGALILRNVRRDLSAVARRAKAEARGRVSKDGDTDS